MAKSARASDRKRNNQALRKTVFGPAHDARTERLSAKLQELAAKPKPEVEKEIEMEVETEVDAEMKEDLSADQTSSKAASSKRSDVSRNKSSRIEKKGRRKPRNLVVFPTSIAKQKRIARSKKKSV